MTSNETEKPFIVWVNHGMGQWSPNGFGTADEVMEYIRNGQTYGCPHVVTQTMRVSMSLTLNREEHSDRDN